MLRTRIMLPFVAVTCGVLAAQTSPPEVVFHGNCENGLPHYQQWFQKTRLPQGEAYLAPDKRKQQMLSGYPKLKLQMSLEEVEKLLGQPDFSSPLPAARLATAPEVAKASCSNQIAYIVNKSSENMADTSDVAVYLVFSRSGKLYWAVPQNISRLRELGSPTPWRPVEPRISTSTRVVALSPV